MNTLKEKFDNYTPIPDPSVWEAIDNTLLRRSRRRKAVIASAAAAVVAAATTLILLHTPSEAPKELAAVSGGNAPAVSVADSSLTQQTVLNDDNEAILPSSPVTVSQTVKPTHHPQSISNSASSEVLVAPAEQPQKIQSQQEVRQSVNSQPVAAVAAAPSPVYSESEPQQSNTNTSSLHQNTDNTKHSATVAQQPKASVQDSLVIWIPNAFSPNDPYEEKARIFKVTPNEEASILSFEIFIYSRTGRLVYHSKDINEGWNGKSRGQDQPMGTYVYVIEIHDAVRGIQHARGNITLLR